MRNVFFFGGPLAGKTSTLEALAERSGAAMRVHADETHRFVEVLDSGLRLVTVPGNVFYESTVREPLVECDALVFTLDALARRPPPQGYFQRHAAEIRPMPRIYQISKIDLPDVAHARGLLRECGWDETAPVFETSVLRNEGIDALAAGIRALLDETGPPPDVVLALREAFPERAAELIDALERRWLGAGRGALVQCTKPRCEAVLSVRLFHGGHTAVASSLATRPFAGGVLRVPSPMRLSRDGLLAELRRALAPERYDRAEHGCGQDVETRRITCPACRSVVRLEARLQETGWRIVSV